MIDLVTGARVKASGGALRRMQHAPYFMTTSQDEIQVTLPARGVSEILSFGVSGEGSAEVFNIAGYFESADTDCLIQMHTNDGSQDIPLMSSPVHADTICGTNLRPYRLPETLYVDELRRVKVRLTNLLDDDNDVALRLGATRNAEITVDPNAGLKALRLRDKARLTFPYWYTLNEGVKVLPANTTWDQVITTTDSNFDFQLYQLTGVSTGTYRIDILDGNTGESLLNAPSDDHYLCPSELYIGTAQYPFRFHTPRMIRAGQLVIVRLQDTSGLTNTVYLTLGGRKLARQLWGPTEL